MPQLFESMYECLLDVSYPSCRARLLKRRRTETYHLAYRTPANGRWKVSAPFLHAFALNSIQAHQRRMMRGEGYATLIHLIKTHQRETIAGRFKRHRRRLDHRREVAQMTNLPTFGMFG